MRRSAGKHVGSRSRSRASCSNLKAAIGKARNKRNRGKALAKFNFNCTKQGKKRRKMK